MVIDATAILKEVQENLRKLESCPGPHDFQPHELLRGTLTPRSYLCSKCGGVLDSLKVIWYKKGLAHATR